MQAKDYFTAMFWLACEDQMLHKADVSAYKKGVAGDLSASAPKKDAVTSAGMQQSGRQ